MSNELHLVNLHQIISEKNGNIESAPLEIQKHFLQKIGDDIFFMPPSYSKGYKFKYMLLNYLNLKAEIKSRLEEEIISRWQSFYEPAKEASARTTPEPKEAANAAEPSGKNQEITPAESQDISPAPPQKTSPAKVADIEKPLLKKKVDRKTAGKRSKDKKAMVKTITAKKTGIKQSAASKPESKKPVTRKTANQKQAIPKKPTSVSGKKTTGSRIKGANERPALQKELQDLTRDMRSLENKIEKMMKAFDGVQSKADAKTRPVKKRSTPKTAKKKDAATSDTEKVIKLITKRKKNGIDAPTLSEKTGFNPQRIRGMISRALKNGKIKRVGKGLYLGA